MPRSKSAEKGSRGCRARRAWHERIMASLSLKHIYKVYDGTTKAVNDFNMEIQDKEFIVFVGPSGCGKSTTLRMIAGLEDISAGELRIDGVIVNDMEPKDRNIAMVFQNYALYPHMTVYENLAFSLKTAHMPKEQIHEKVTEAARILGITEYLGRKPKALSGGQRQRVALGRAIVRHPKVFLLDEPLSNLDAKLRAAMRAEITRLYERLGTTFIYVTHDQVEAMTMGSRIVVMRGGYVQQIDTPKNLYNHPANLFVAGFIGTPRMNFWDATMEKEGGTVRIRLKNGAELTVAYTAIDRIQTRYMDGTHPVIIGVRPDDVRLWDDSLDPAVWARLTVTVSVVEAPGGETLIYGVLGAKSVNDHPIGDMVEATERTESGRSAKSSATEVADDTVIAKADADCTVARGDTVEVAVNLGRLHVFDRNSEQNICPRVPQENICRCTVEGNTLSFAGQRFSLPPALTDRTADEAELTLPCTAILPGTGSGHARVEEIEDCTDSTVQGRSDNAGVGNTPTGTTAPSARTLYRLTVGDTTLFALENAPPRLVVGESVPFDIDFSRITVEACGIFPLPEENQLNGCFVKEKVLDSGDGEKTVGRARSKRRKRGYRFYLDVSDQPITAEDELCQKLFSCKGTAIFHTPLSYRFSSASVTVAPRGRASGEGRSCLSGKVTDILDYGRTVYARIAVGGQRLIAPYRGAKGDAVSLTIDQNRLTVVDREADIIIV